MGTGTSFFSFFVSIFLAVPKLPIPQAAKVAQIAQTDRPSFFFFPLARSESHRVFAPPRASWLSLKNGSRKGPSREDGVIFRARIPDSPRASAVITAALPVSFASVLQKSTGARLHSPGHARGTRRNPLESGDDPQCQLGLGMRPWKLGHSWPPVTGTTYKGYRRGNETWTGFARKGVCVTVTK